LHFDANGFPIGTPIGPEGPRGGTTRSGAMGRKDFSGRVLQSITFKRFVIAALP